MKQRFDSPEFLRPKSQNDIFFTPTMNRENPFSPNSWVEISAAALEHNIAQYKKVVGPNIVLAPVIKANAYGHGIEGIAALLNDNPSVGLICVAKLSEALALREEGIEKPLLVLSIIDAPPEHAITHNIRVAIWDFETAQFFDAMAQALGLSANIHIKVDTGLSRLGKHYNDAYQFVTQCSKLKHSKIEGLFTHFANSENIDSTFTHVQIERFNDVIQSLKRAGINPPLIHCASSAGQTTIPSSHFSMVRLGIGLYGLWPSESNKNKTIQNHPDFFLQPVMEWKTHITMLKTVPAESFVGYDLTYKTTRETRIATLPIGYSDGYNRQLSNKGIVKIHNQYAPVIGRVAMNLTMIDVTGITETKLNDEVILLGNDEKVNAQTIAQSCNTINYEIVTNINREINRIIID